MTKGFLCDKCGIHFGNGILMGSSREDGEITLCDFCYSSYKKAFQDAFKNGTDWNGSDEYSFRLEFKKQMYNPSSRRN
jgi:hypothetical protein